MQRSSHRCPRCDKPLGICCDMWGRYYLCGGCGFTAEDDDDLRNGNGHKPLLQELPDLSQIERYPIWQTSRR